MANNAYVVPNVRVTGTQDNYEVVLFSSLVDQNGNTVPSEFNPAPRIGMLAPLQDRRANVRNITTTQFEIALSDLGDLSVTAGRFDLIIYGQPAST